MKKIILFLTFIFCLEIAFTQIMNPNQKPLTTLDNESTDLLKLFENIRFSFHLGVNFCNDSQIKDYYRSQLFFDYGIEIRHRKRGVNTILPFLSYDRVNYIADNFDPLHPNVNILNPKIDSVLKINQFSLGFQCNLKQNKLNSYYSILGVNLGEYRITDTQHNMTYLGLRMGFGLEHAFNQNKLITNRFEIIFDLNKANFSQRSEATMNYNNFKVRYAIGF